MPSSMRRMTFFAPVRLTASRMASVWSPWMRRAPPCSERVPAACREATPWPVTVETSSCARVPVPWVRVAPVTRPATAAAMAGTVRRRVRERPRRVAAGVAPVSGTGWVCWVGFVMAPR